MVTRYGALLDMIAALPSSHGAPPKQAPPHWTFDEAMRVR